MRSGGWTNFISEKQNEKKMSHRVQVERNSVEMTTTVSGEKRLIEFPTVYSFYNTLIRSIGFRSPHRGGRGTRELGAKFEL